MEKEQENVAAPLGSHRPDQTDRMKGRILDVLQAGEEPAEAPVGWADPEHQIPLSPTTGLPLKRSQYDIVRVQDAYVCDLAAFRILNREMASNVELAAMLEQGYFYLCAPGCPEEEELPAGWRRWVVVWSELPADRGSREWMEHLAPFRRVFQASQYRQIRGSLQSYVAVCQYSPTDVLYRVEPHAVVFVTGSSLLYDCLSKGAVEACDLKGDAEGIEISRLWDVSSGSDVDPRRQIRLSCRFFEDFNSLFDKPDGVRPPSWSPSDLLINSALDTYICDKSAYAKLNAAAVDPTPCKKPSIRLALRGAGVLYKLRLSDDEDDEGDSAGDAEFPGWKPWVVEFGVSQEVVDDIVRKVVGDEEVARLGDGVVKSVREFIAACVRKREDEYHDVPSSLLVFCTGNREFFSKFIGCSHGWMLLKEIVGRVLALRDVYSDVDGKHDFVCRAWDVSGSLDPCTQLLMEHPARIVVRKDLVLVDVHQWRIAEAESLAASTKRVVYVLDANVYIDIKNKRLPELERKLLGQDLKMTTINFIEVCKVRMPGQVAAFCDPLRDFCRPDRPQEALDGCKLLWAKDGFRDKLARSAVFEKRKRPKTVKLEIVEAMDEWDMAAAELLNKESFGMLSYASLCMEACLKDNVEFKYVTSDLFIRDVATAAASEISRSGNVFEGMKGVMVYSPGMLGCD